ncbi:MAG: aldehyde dehydrogenase [Clostridiaceae bacterium]|nr:aldehyde dehydrogenase [Clostridiaceae bacterium]
MEDGIQEIFDIKRKFFDEGNTKSYEFRIKQLNKLKSVIKSNEKEILEALYKDLGKPAFEAFTSEIGVMYEEINYAVKNLKSWMKPEKVGTPLVMQPSKSVIYSEPLGVVLIIGPWNYPFQLLLAPLIGAISAGNCAVIKPSDQSKHTSDIVKKLIEENFPKEFISVVQGPGAMIGPMLIERFRFDYIFFTGSPSVGRKIAEMAAKNLTPVTLELGGKSPVIVDKDADIDLSAKRLTWAKYFNAGQTCVCPDYLLVHESIKNKFIDRMKHYIKEFFGDDPEKSNSFGRIINKKRFNILSNYLKEGHIAVGGQTNEVSLYLAPTIIDNITLNDKIMKEEIFGPIMPVMTFKDITEVLAIIRKNPYPLAAYLYTNNEKSEKFIIENIQFGGGCINNSMMHLMNSNVPFGGVGFSGMGMYHGKYSFDTFSHKKSIVKTKPYLDQSLRYAPYNDNKMNLAKKFFK